jgi:hypothetical protein
MGGSISGPLEKVDPSEAWAPWTPDKNNPFNLKWAGHLFRRATFGVGIDRLRAAVDSGLEATLAELLNGEVGAVNDYYTRERIALKTYEERSKMPPENQQDPFDLQVWWFDILLNSMHPLREKMTLFWHNHFCSSIAKVKSGKLMAQQNIALRKYALSKFGPFLQAMTADPALLIYLDSNDNKKGNPNENYAREVMELFSLGVGNYTETDIREAARAFTGWHTEGEEFFFNRREHDRGVKKVLGKEGNWKGDDVVRVILQQPAVANFIVGKMYRFLVSEIDPPAALLKPLADSFRKSDYDIGALAATILRSKLFFSAHAYRRRIKSPVEFIISTVRTFMFGDWPVPENALVTKLEAMGQLIMAPPNVKGWPGGTTWLNTSTILARHNFAYMAASGFWPENTRNGSFLERIMPEEEKNDDVPRFEEEPDPPGKSDVATYIRNLKIQDPKIIVDSLLELLLQGEVNDKAHRALVAFLVEGNPQGKYRSIRIRDIAHAIMTMPEFQLA